MSLAKAFAEYLAGLQEHDLKLFEIAVQSERERIIDKIEELKADIPFKNEDFIRNDIYREIIKLIKEQ